MSMKAVEFNHVNMKYNEQYVLQDINFSIKEKDFMAIIGPNGGGKSTILKIILGLLTPDDGEVKVFGNLSFDPQFPISVYETVLTGRYHGLFKSYKQSDEEAVIQALNDVEMQDFKDRQIGKLSGGQMQRVFIARAIVRNPKLLLMDEPMASIDPDMQSSFYKLMSQLKDEMAIVLVSHDVGEIYHCPIDLISHGIPHRVLREH